MALDDREPPAPNPPSQEELNTIVGRVIEAIKAGSRRPFETALSPAEYTKVVHYCAGHPIEALSAFALVTFQASHMGWPESHIRKLETAIGGFRSAGAKLARTHDDWLRRQARAIDQAARGSSRENQRRAVTPPERVPELSPDDMIDQPSPRMKAIGHLLKRKRGRIWYDEFFDRVLLDWDGRNNDREIDAYPLTDATIRKVGYWLATVEPGWLADMSLRTVREVIYTVAEMDVRNAPKDAISGLVWDKVERLDEMLVKGFGVEDTPYHRAVSRNVLISMVARLMEPGCQVDNMMVLQGEEGLNKSKALRILGGRFFGTVSSDIGSKDFKQEIRGLLLIEIPELHSIIGGRSDKTKAVISNITDRLRDAYAAEVKDHKRIAVFVGTTNEKDWHKEARGGRRFWVIMITKEIDLAWLTENRTQLWAEALAAWQLGTSDPRGRWWEVPKEAHADALERARAVPIYAERIAQWLSMASAEVYDGTMGVPAIAANRYGENHGDIVWGTLVTTDRVAAKALRLDHEMLSRNRNAHHIGEALRHLGWEPDRRKVSGVTNEVVRFWAKASPSVGDITRAAAPSDQPGASAQPGQPRLDDDIPF